MSVRIKNQKYQGYRRVSGSKILILELYDPFKGFNVIYEVLIVHALMLDYYK